MIYIVLRMCNNILLQDYLHTNHNYDFRHRTLHDKVAEENSVSIQEKAEEERVILVKVEAMDFPGESMVNLGSHKDVFRIHLVHTQPYFLCTHIHRNIHHRVEYRNCKTIHNDNLVFSSSKDTNHHSSRLENLDLHI